ncbi:cyclic AMP-responsive element-binding protein 3-like protein 3-A [Aplochiton taeniatus]
MRAKNANDFLETLLGGSDSSSPPNSPLWSPCPSDSGISEDPASDHLDSPHPSASPRFQAFYPHPLPQTPSPSHSSSGMPAPMSTTPDFTIDLGWESGLFPENFGVAHYLSTNNNSRHATYPLTVKDLLLSNLGQKTQGNSQHALHELVLNEDEKKLLAKEGVHLPEKLPLSKHEERVLKKIRRKIRNKQSAQESRKKKREYVDSLEGRMSACSSHNLELQRKVYQLEETNTSLLEELARLQALLPNSIKTAQTGTCILVLLLSLSLLLSPSLQPEPYSQASQGDYSETRVQSRSLQSLVDSESGPPPAPIEARGMEALSSLLEMLWSGPEHADTDQHSNHYRDHKHKLHR